MSVSALSLVVSMCALPSPGVHGAPAAQPLGSDELLRLHEDPEEA